MGQQYQKYLVYLKVQLRLTGRQDHLGLLHQQGLRDQTLPRVQLRPAYPVYQLRPMDHWDQWHQQGLRDPLRQ